MEMVMPSTYRALENDEMMYLEGGGIPRDWAGWAVDAALALTGLGGMAAGSKSIGALIAKVGKNQIANVIIQATGKLGFIINHSKALAAAGFLGTIAGFSVGSAIAHAIDWADGSYNGWIF